MRQNSKNSSVTKLKTENVTTQKLKTWQNYKKKIKLWQNSKLNMWENIPILLGWFTKSSFSSKSATYHKSQTVGTRDLKCWNNVHRPLCVTYHMSCVTGHMSGVTCQESHVMWHMSLFSFCKVTELVGGWSVIKGAYPVYFKSSYPSSFPGVW